MKLQLSRPLVFFDLETTGVNIAKDRIVELSYYKLFPNGTKEGRTWRVRPTIIDALGLETTMHIPEQASAVHGIYDDDVRDCPTFNEIAREVASAFEGADIAGYNSNHFDIPMLGEEFLRAGVQFDFTQRSMIDVFTIFTRKEQRTLSAAYAFYCGKDLTDAHSANADTMATYEVLMAQTERYPDLPQTIEGLAQYSAPSQRYADLAGKLSYNDKGEVVFAFGKYKDVPVSEVLVKDSGYYGWIMQGDFPQYTKNVIANIKLQQRLAAKKI
ncbi:MAG: 3'-5' exonuclease [Paludibacteraceae bacterium]|nr:3'-5' exonuclease [Paludibacteraceae bacterium]